MVQVFSKELALVFCFQMSFEYRLYFTDVFENRKPVEKRLQKLIIFKNGSYKQKELKKEHRLEIYLLVFVAFRLGLVPLAYPFVNIAFAPGPLE